MSQHPYTPNIVSHPSETIYDFLMEDPREYFCRLYELNPEFARNIVEYMAAAGTDIEVKMTEGLAQNLHIVFGASKEFWITRDKHYEEWRAKQKK